MRATVHPGGSVGGTAVVPGDKSIAHRWLILAGTGEGRSEIRQAPEALDVKATARVLAKIWRRRLDLHSTVGPRSPSHRHTVTVPRGTNLDLESPRVPARSRRSRWRVGVEAPFTLLRARSTARTRARRCACCAASWRRRRSSRCWRATRASRDVPWSGWPNRSAAWAPTSERTVVTPPVVIRGGAASRDRAHERGPERAGEERGAAGRPLGRGRDHRVRAGDDPRPHGAGPPTPRRADHRVTGAGKRSGVPARRVRSQGPGRHLVRGLPGGGGGAHRARPSWSRGWG